jgi:aspartyl/asparaginyl-tRNA synthetase
VLYIYEHRYLARNFYTRNARINGKILKDDVILSHSFVEIMSGGECK